MHQQLKDNFGKLISLVKCLGDVDGIISIKTHSKGAFGFNEFLDLAFFFIEYIWHDVQKGSVSILSQISSQTFEVSPAINDIVYIRPSLWFNNPKATFFLGYIFFDLEICFISPQNAFLLCARFGRVTAFLSSLPKFTVQNVLWNKKVCP